MINNWAKNSFLLIMLSRKLGLVFVLLLAGLMRFYKLHQLQYYSFDDEVAAMFMYNLVVRHKLLLVGTTATLDIPLGAWWHWLSGPLFFGFKFDPMKILAFGSLLGVVVTYMMYRLGTALGNQRVGWWASFLYAGSFMTALLDRRWWALSLDPVFMMVAIFSIYKIVQGNLTYLLPLTAVAAFGWQLDPTLGVIVVAAVLAGLIFKIRLSYKICWLALPLVVMSFLPLVILELRHPKAVITPYTRLLNRSDQMAPADQHKNELTVNAMSLGFSRAFWSKPTDTAENYMFPGSSSEHLDFHWGVKLLTVLLIVMPIYWLFTDKDRWVVGLKVLYVFLVAFLLSVVVVNSVAKIYISQHYYAVIWPVGFLLAGFTLDWLYRKKQKLLVLAGLAIFLGANLQTLWYSQMRYPLDQKMKLIKLVVSNLEPRPFSMYVLDDIHLYGGGLGGILAKYNFFPSNQSYYGFDWTFRAFSLYQVSVVDEDKFDQRVVVYPEWVQPDWSEYAGVTKTQAYQVGKMKAMILRPVEDGND